MNEGIIVKLVTGDELIGILKKTYSDGGIILGNVMEITTTTEGIAMRPYMLSAQEDLEFNTTAIITTCDPISEILDIYMKSSKYWPTSAWLDFDQPDKRSVN